MCQKQDPSIHSPQETHFKYEDKDRLKVNDKINEKVYHAHGKHNEAGEAIIISNKIDFKIKSIIRPKWGHNNKRDNSPGRHIIVKVYMFNNQASKSLKQKLTKIEKQQGIFTLLSN